MCCTDITLVEMLFLQVLIKFELQSKFNHFQRNPFRKENLKTPTDFCHDKVDSKLATF